MLPLGGLCELFARRILSANLRKKQSQTRRGNTNIKLKVTQRDKRLLFIYLF